MSDPTDTASERPFAPFAPKFDSAGLLTAVVSHAVSAELLMVAHMNAEALDATIRTGRAHFWSRSRGKLWMKGETSGHVLHVQEIRVDCDQDCLWLLCLPSGPACHTGRASCFYRILDREGRLAPATERPTGAPHWIAP
jgi:phosphoribosyl-AMP cyclohydrolase